MGRDETQQTVALVDVPVCLQRLLHGYECACTGLQDGVPVPEVRHFVAADQEAWLLTTEVPGRTATQALCGSGDDPLAVVDALADFLQRFHSLAIEACPFNSDHHLRMIQARERLDAGLIDCDDFDDEHRRWTAAKVWAALVGLLSITCNPVETHGDFSLDNVLRKV